MAFIQREYWKFYVMGRSERKLIKTDRIEDDIVASILLSDGPSLRDAVTSACQKAAAPLEAGRTRRQWIKANKAEIATAGGDDAAAYKAWLQGRADELAFALEEDVLIILAAKSGAVGDEADDEDEDEEDGEEDEDEDDGEEDEDEEDDDDAAAVAPRRSGTRR